MAELIRKTETQKHAFSLPFLLHYVWVKGPELKYVGDYCSYKVQITAGPSVAHHDLPVVVTTSSSWEIPPGAKKGSMAQTDQGNKIAAIQGWRPTPTERQLCVIGQPSWGEGRPQPWACCARTSLMDCDPGWQKKTLYTKQQETVPQNNPPRLNVDGLCVSSGENSQFSFGLRSGNRGITHNCILYFCSKILV